MVETTLVDKELVTTGQAVLDALNSAGIAVKAAIWQYDHVIFRRWQLLLVVPLVEQIGPKAAHRRIDEVLDKAEIRDVDVQVMTPEASYYRRLVSSLAGRDNSVLIDEVIDDDGFSIKRGYVYFVQ